MSELLVEEQLSCPGMSELLVEEQLSCPGMSELPVKGQLAASEALVPHSLLSERCGRASRERARSAPRAARRVCSSAACSAARDRLARARVADRAR
jgi:hypothetical protein